MKTLIHAMMACVSFGCLAADGGYKVVKKEVIGGNGSWDYVTIDSEARRAYITRETHVMVVDMESLKVVKDIEGTAGVHGVALVPELNRGFISCGRSNTVVVIDTKTLEKVGEVTAGKKPDAIAYDPASKRVFAMNNGGTNATAIDAATMKAVGEVELGGAPESAVSDGKGHMYANLEDKGEIVAFDPVKLTVLNRWPLSPAKTPTGLAFDAEHHRLFSGCRGGKAMVVVDSESGKIVSSLPIGGGVDACAFDAQEQNAFSSNGEGNLTVVHQASPEKYSVLQTVTTAPGAKTMGFDEKKHQLWLVCAETKTENNKRTVVPNSFSVLIVGK